MKILIDIILFIAGLYLTGIGFEYLEQSAKENKVMPFIVGFFYIVIGVITVARIWNIYF